MLKILSKTALAVAVCAFCSTAAYSAEFKEITLRLAHTAATSHAHNKAAEQFAKNVKERTGRKVTVACVWQPNYQRRYISLG